MRNARYGRTVLLLASVLAVAGSFGLHPEPATRFDGSGASVGLVTSIDRFSHGCPACLAHRAISLIYVFDASPRPIEIATRVFSLSAPPAPRLDGFEAEGRAPPALF